MDDIELDKRRVIALEQIAKNVLVIKQLLVAIVVFLAAPYIIDKWF
ncbi:hypothetical protein [Vibrio agarivorans]|nr:hypothetical protein [Vibrio agarivorans]MDN3663147.1 hypothetical protein [Vibrio agarivorans]